MSADTQRTPSSSVPGAHFVLLLCRLLFFCEHFRGIGFQVAAATWKPIPLWLRTTAASFDPGPPGRGASFQLAAATALADDNVPPEGFAALFNGKDFTGWPVENQQMGEFAEADRGLAPRG